MMESSTSSLNREAVAWLIKRMASFWGKAFYDKWAVLKDGEMLETWTSAMRGLTSDEWRRGVTSLYSFDRPPSLPEFLKACRPDVDPIKAYYEAIEQATNRERGEVGIWSHPAIYWAAVRVSMHDLKTLSFSQIRPRWEAALSAEFAKGVWAEIPAPMLAIAGPVEGKISKERAAQMMQQIREVAGQKVVGSLPMSDGKDWARKILKRHAEGDKTLKLIQIQFAREALKWSDYDEEH